jgi:hypothetical protein
VASSRSAALCVAPADYAELYLEYGGDIKRVVWRQLGALAKPADVDEGVQYIVQQLMPNEKRPGIIEQYRPDHVSDFNGKPVTFKAFLLARVALYCRGIGETLRKRSGRELLLIDTTVGEDGSMPWLDLLGGTVDEYPSLADTDALARLRDALAVFAPVPGSEPVLPLFDALAEQFASGKTVSAAAVRRKFRKTPEQADAWMAELRDALREVVGSQAPPLPAPVPEPVPASSDDAWMAELREVTSGEATFELGGMRLSGTEVRAAAEALKAAKGNRVLPAFKDAGHRLADAGKTWYLGFAEAVMQAHPELRTPARRHAEGHFGRVKQALIYGLELLAADVPVAEPVTEAVDVPVVPSAELWAELEGVLARFPGFDPDTTGAALEAVRLLAAA